MKRIQETVNDLGGAALGRQFRHYVLAVGAVGLATGVRWMLDSVLGRGEAYITFYPAVAIVGIVAGGRAGIVATLLSTAVVDWLFLEPRYRFAVSGPGDAVALGLFVAAGVVMSVTGERVGQARKREWQAIEREKAVETLRAGEARLLAVLDQAPCGITIREMPSGRMLLSNERAAGILGKTVPTLEEVGLYRGIHSDGSAYRREDYPLVRAAERGETVRNEEFSFERNDGERRTLSISAAPIRGSDGQVIATVAVLDDITERKQAEKALRESEELFRVMFTQSAVGKVQTDPATGRFLRANAAFCRLTGYSEKELLDRTFLELTHPEDREADRARLSALARGEVASFESEKRYVRKDGAVVWGLVCVNLLHDALGRPVHTMAVIQDITERKQAEQASRRYELLADHSRDIILFVDRNDGRVLEANAAAFKHYGYSREELLQLTIHDLRVAETRALTEEQMALAEKVGIQFETVHRQKDGGTFPVEVSSRGAQMGDRRVLISLVRDISERKRAEERLRDSLREKEVLLKEVHHRVKNNLQIIASLVDLQSCALAEPALRSLFQDVRDRVRSMALVHEKLYQSESLAQVEFADYARSLLTHLARSHANIQCDIALKLDLQPVSLSVETAVPCGLILNELISNVFKHAFHGRAKGEVTTAFGTTADGRVFLRVSDDGVGLPPGMDWRQSRSLGLRLIHLLAGQLNASVQVRTGGGTAFEMSFALAEAQAG